MRVSELANELGKTSKEVLDIIKQKDSFCIFLRLPAYLKTRETMVRNAVSQKKRGSTKGRSRKSRTCKEETDCCFPSAECKAADQAPGTKGAA